MLDLEAMVQQSTHFLEMESSQLLDFLHMTNIELKQLFSDDSTFSYDVYWALLILTHNFNMVVDSNYLSRKGAFSFLSKKLSSYYKVGGNRDVFPYLIGIDSWEEKLSNVVTASKQEFVVNTICYGYEGLPEQLKFFCEVPDFYPTVSAEMREKIYQKKDS